MITEKPPWGVFIKLLYCIVLYCIFLGDFSFLRIFLKNYRVTMTTTLDTSCSENTTVLSARRGFLHACIF